MIKKQSFYHFSQILINKKSSHNFLIFAELKKSQILQNFIKNIVNCTQGLTCISNTKKSMCWNAKENILIR